MRPTSQNSIQLQSIFGGGYIPEQHSDQTDCHLPMSDSRDLTESFDAVLKALRAALSLR